MKDAATASPELPEYRADSASAFCHGSHLRGRGESQTEKSAFLDRRCFPMKETWGFGSWGDVDSATREMGIPVAWFFGIAVVIEYNYEYRFAEYEHDSELDYANRDCFDWLAMTYVMSFTWRPSDSAGSV
jgi:hypothetical protein